MKGVNIFRVEDLQDILETFSTRLPNGQYGPVRPIGCWDLPHRIKIAWLVFTGKADAVTWPGGQ